MRQRKYHVDGDLQRAYHSLCMAQKHGSKDDFEFWSEAWEYEQKQARVHGYTSEMIGEAIAPLKAVHDGS